jgi:chaperonin GroES
VFDSKQKQTGKVMAKIKIRPLDDRVVVEPMAADEVTAGGILLPDSAKEKPQRGTVIAVGPGKLLDSGERGELSVAVGDEVIFGKYGGTEIEVNGTEVKILRESDILAKVL